MKYVPSFYLSSDQMENYFSLLRILNAINPTQEQVIAATRHALMARNFAIHKDGTVLNQGHVNNLTIFDICKNETNEAEEDGEEIKSMSQP